MMPQADVLSALRGCSVLTLQCAGRERIAAERAVNEMNMVAAKRRRRKAGHHGSVLLMDPVAHDAGVGSRDKPRLDGARQRRGAIEHHAQSVVVLAKVGIVPEVTEIAGRDK